MQTSVRLPKVMPDSRDIYEHALELLALHGYIAISVYLIANLL